MIIEEKNTIRAERGFVLTNGCVYTTSANLGSVDRVENWYEITEEEYQAIMKEQEEQF
jgi:hypothetical protein